ncbi:MAG: AbrB/MazE/SpoVT family DNA-binding domain-containing protein [Armatimonadota bacterium]
MGNTVTISNRGVITLPKYAREALKAKPGDRLAFLIEGGAIRVIREPVLQEKARQASD